MKVQFADSFGTSIKKLIRDNRWYNRAWRWIRRDVPHFWKNVWKFRAALSKHYWWDYNGTLKFMEIAINDIAINVELKGLEVDESRLKKVAAMKRAVEILNHINKDSYIEMAEAKYGEVIFHGFEFEDAEDHPGYYQLVDKETPKERKHNSKVYEYARKLEEQEWKELWKLLEGQHYKDYEKTIKHLTPEERRKDDHYYKWFDGSGLKGWWD
jgi:hypothetical protein